MEQQGDGCCSPPSWLDQRDIREQQRTFQSLAAYSYDNNFLVTAQKQTRHFAGGYVTADYFHTLGVRPVAGRVFTAAEAQPGRDHVVLLREDFWRSEFGNKADNHFSILGTTMLVNGVKCDVIGILPAWFGFPSEDAVIWTPLVPTTVQATQRGWHGFPMVGRIKRAFP
jgi:putative ABC transport system permease protein